MTTERPVVDVHRASTLDDALAALSHGPRVVIAGATDVMVALHAGSLSASAFLDIGGLDSLRTIAVREDVLVIGALVTFRDLSASVAVRERVPMLIEAAGQIGGAQIQNRATIGGNVANSSPAGDSLPVLAVSDAIVVLRSVAGERRIPYTDFPVGYRRTAMRRDELLVAIEIPRIVGRQSYRKVGARAAQTIAKVVVAAIDGPTIRLAVGSVAPTTVRLPRTERAIAEGGDEHQICAALHSEIAPIDDVRSTAEYRRRVTENLILRIARDRYARVGT